MGKTSSTVKNRYRDKKYDRIEFVVPKGQKKIFKELCANNNTNATAELNKFIEMYIENNK